MGHSLWTVQTHMEHSVNKVETEFVEFLCLVWPNIRTLTNVFKDMSGIVFQTSWKNIPKIFVGCLLPLVLLHCCNNVAVWSKWPIRHLKDGTADLHGGSTSDGTLLVRFLGASETGQVEELEGKWVNKLWKTSRNERWLKTFADLFPTSDLT